jgi:hypothetical protein
VTPPICSLRDPDGTSPDGYLCTQPLGHTGDHEAHGRGPGNVVRRWARRSAGEFEQGCAGALAGGDAAELEGAQRGDAAPEEVEARRRQMRVAGGTSGGAA